MQIKDKNIWNGMVLVLMYLVAFLNRTSMSVHINMLSLVPSSHRDGGKGFIQEMAYHLVFKNK